MSILCYVRVCERKHFYTFIGDQVIVIEKHSIRYMSYQLHHLATQQTASVNWPPPYGEGTKVRPLRCRFGWHAITVLSDSWAHTAWSHFLENKFGSILRYSNCLEYFLYRCFNKINLNPAKFLIKFLKFSLTLEIEEAVEIYNKPFSCWPSTK